MSKPIPSEFVGFVRETGVRAFDRLASRSKNLDRPLRAFLKNWTLLTEGEKHTLFDELIAAVGSDSEEQEPPPSLKQKRPVKRYDPEEVAATLPRKPAVRKPAARKKAKKKIE